MMLWATDEVWGSSVKKILKGGDTGVVLGNCT